MIKAGIIASKILPEEIVSAVTYKIQEKKLDNNE
jgi:hypothetical protein